MFYEVDKIEANLNCPQCGDRFRVPRILPCGKTICQNCLDDLNETKRDMINVIRCPLCRRSHTVPDEGFILNEFIVKCLEIKPEKVYRLLLSL
jgi:hypothetical protein